MALHFRRLGDVVIDVKNSYEWYQRLGFKLAGTRLEKIQDYILYQLLNSATPEARALEEGTADEDTYYALSDGAGFGLIAEAIAKLPSHLLPRGTLKDLLQGPLALSNEMPQDSVARNKFVELEMAAYYSRAGFKLLGFDDLKFEFEGLEYQVECKRPFSAGALYRNIGDAYRQLSPKLGRDDSRGIIAIAVEKVFDLDRNFQRVLSLSSVSELGRQIADKFRTKVVKFDSQWVDTRIVGVLAIIRLLVKTEEPKTIGPSYSLGLVMRASPEVGQAVDCERLKRIVSQLQSSFSVQS
jgi:hypothetical protein